MKHINIIIIFLANITIFIKVSNNDNIYDKSSFILLQYIISINCYYYLFVDTEDSENIKTISKDDILEFYKIYIHPKSPKIRKLSVHVRSLKCADNKSEDKATSTDSKENEKSEEKENKDNNESKEKENKDDESKDDDNKYAELERLKPENYILSEENIIITDISDFKNGMCFGPTATPVVPLKTFYAEDMFN
jgi:hypothetical protein